MAITPEQIEAEALKAASLSSDAGSVQRRSADDLIKLKNHAGAERAAANPNGLFGLRGIQIVPGSPNS